jgi:NAD(P)H-dependent flavin oxidoreductase YrpB (nitropropane dioxygenase family)
MQLSPQGEPIYGPRDVPDLEKIRDLGLPFWLAGSYGRPGKLAEALSRGAAGIQVGTAFAFCEESGVSPDLKHQAIELSRQGKARVFTDPVASPTGFPFKVAMIEGTLWDEKVYASRKRICDLGYLRHVYRKADGTVGYRCPAEPVENFVKKGGQLSDTKGRNCVCNGLSGAVGLNQSRGDFTEPALVTAGNDFETVAQFVKPGASTYTAGDVIKILLG